MTVFLRVALAALTVLYPFAVYLALTFFDASIAILLLLALALIRCLIPASGIGPAWLWVLVALLIAGHVWASGSTFGLKMYPVFVNTILLFLFGWSLWRPPSMIERLARMREPALPDSGVRYTRKVTMVWCAFFVVNGAIAAATGLFASDEVWLLYNGLIAYMLIGALFGVEWCVRYWVRGRHA